MFGEPFHESLVHEAARADLNARRQGTASTLTRGEVSMTTAKAFRQKGTGRARAGALSTSSRYGGGVTFGPKPRHYTFKINRKARRKALRAALSVHATRGTLAMIDAAEFGEPSTKKAAEALESTEGARTLIVLGSEGEEKLRQVLPQPSEDRRHAGRRRGRGRHHRRPLAGGSRPPRSRSSAARPRR